MSDKPIEIDWIVLICNGCGAKRYFTPRPHLVGAQALIEWMQTKPTPCECGARTCDVKAKAHVVGDPPVTG